MSVETKTFVVRHNDRTEIQEFLNALSNAENINEYETTDNGVTTVTLTWNDTTAPSEYDVQVTNETDPDGTYYLSEMSTDGMAYDETTGKYIATLTIKRKVLPIVSIDQKTSDSDAEYCITNIQKTSSSVIETTKSPIPSVPILTVGHYDENGASMTPAKYTGRYVKKIELSGTELKVHYDLLRFL